jgi:hypothetical protein
VTGLSSSVAVLAGTPKIKEGLFVTSVPALPPPLKLNETPAGVVDVGVGVVVADWPKVKTGVEAGFASETVGVVLGVAPKGKSDDFTSSFFSCPNAKVLLPKRGLGADNSTAGGATVVCAVEPNAKAAFGTSSTAGVEGVAPEGPKVNGRGDGVDCGGGMVVN